jgi:hypothetical protein
VYFTSTTGFNVRLLLPREIAAKALTLPPISFRSEAQFAFPVLEFTIALEDTRTKSAWPITFLAVFHLFRASINCGLPLLFLRCIPAKFASCIVCRLLLYLVGCETIALFPTSRY